MLHFEDGSTVYLREVASYLPLKTTWHLLRFESSSTLIYLTVTLLQVRYSIHLISRAVWGEITYIFIVWRNSPQRARASSFKRFLDHTQRRITVGRTPLDEWSARRRDLYLTTHNTHNRQTSMPPVGLEPTISTGERPQTDAWDRTATGTDSKNIKPPP